MKEPLDQRQGINENCGNTDSAESGGKEEGRRFFLFFFLFFLFFFFSSLQLTLPPSADQLSSVSVVDVTQVRESSFFLCHGGVFVVFLFLFSFFSFSFLSFLSFSLSFLLVLTLSADLIFSGAPPQDDM